MNEAFSVIALAGEMEIENLAILCVGDGGGWCLVSGGTKVKLLQWLYYILFTVYVTNFVIFNVYKFNRVYSTYRLLQVNI